MHTSHDPLNTSTVHAGSLLCNPASAQQPPSTCDNCSGVRSDDSLVPVAQSPLDADAGTSVLHPRANDSFCPVEESSDFQISSADDTARAGVEDEPISTVGEIKPYMLVGWTIAELTARITALDTQRIRLLNMGNLDAEARLNADLQVLQTALDYHELYGCIVEHAEDLDCFINPYLNESERAAGFQVAS